jgi:hypothetical protein
MTSLLHRLYLDRLLAGWVSLLVGSSCAFRACVFFGINGRSLEVGLQAVCGCRRARARAREGLGDGIDGRVAGYGLEADLSVAI